MAITPRPRPPASPPAPDPVPGKTWGKTMSRKLRPPEPKPGPPPELDPSIPVDRLSAQQRLFLAHYLGNPARSAYKAAIAAGYSEGYARGNVWALLKKPKMIRAIEQADHLIFDKLHVTHDRILTEMATLAFSNIADYLIQEPHPQDREKTTLKLDVSQATRQQMGAIRELALSPSRQKITLYDKLAALERLGKFSGLFPEVPDNPGGNTRITIELLDGILDGTRSISNLHTHTLPPGLHSKAPEEECSENAKKDPSAGHED